MTKISEIVIVVLSKISKMAVVLLDGVMESWGLELEGRLLGFKFMEPL